MSISKNSKILIVGLGLIGGSYARAFTGQGYEVGAIDINAEDIDYAKENNIIRHGAVTVEKDYVSMFDIVIFALYPKTFIDWIQAFGGYFKTGAIISDVTGVKSSIVYKIQKMLPDGVEFIGAHPMAGREVYGVKNSDANLFANANYIVTPTEANSENAIKTAKAIGKVLCCAKISVLSPEKHDEMIAFLSQLTHCLAVSLMTCKDSVHLKDYTGDSFRDLTRIANINENMWCELFLMNKSELLKQMDLFIGEFTKLKDAIESEDEHTIKQMMQLSTKRRSYFNKK